MLSFSIFPTQWKGEKCLRCVIVTVIAFNILHKSIPSTREGGGPDIPITEFENSFHLI